jgi:type VI secretion system ImpC/EvpB family protein/type VI secretion system ImpB/VipA family protein
MATKLSFGNLQFEVAFGPDGEPIEREPETPFVLAVLGDFSGRASRGMREALGERKVWRVDCDSFEEVFGKLRPQLRLDLPDKGAGASDLSFSSFEDFHPDRLLRQVPAYAALLEQRNRLLNPATSASAAAELQALPTAPLPQPAEPTASSPAPAESDADLMARLLGGAGQASVAPKPKVPASAVEHLIHDAIGSSAVPTATPRQAALLSVLEMEIASHLRRLLHQPQFQALEASWRGLDLLVRNFGGEENLKLCLVDISKEELTSDLQSHDSLASSGVWRMLERQAQETPWAAWLGLYTFGNEPADVDALGRLAKISARARAPFIAAASPSLVACDSFGVHPDPADWKEPVTAEAREGWQALCALPEVSHLGLALPRFLLRLPYGKQSEAIESFGFEEMPGESPHEAYLWGSPAVLCGYLLASAFQADGWDMQPGGAGEVPDLPVHTFQEDGETKVKPCAEAWVTERASQIILNKGLIAVLSIKGRDAVRVVNLQSVGGSALGPG